MYFNSRSYLCLWSYYGGRKTFGNIIWQTIRSVFVFRNLILTIQDEVGDRCFDHPFLKESVVSGINYVNL